MKKINLLILIMLSFLIIGCKEKENEDQKEIDTLRIFVINDLHGALEESNGEYGMARIAWLIEKERQVEGQEVLLLSAGDTFQGSAISNYSYGLNTLKVMNQMEFDAMTIGNHEFDWDLSTILNYVDGDQENGESDFPFLACNIIDKTTNKIPEHVDEYEVVDYGSFQIGIIGYIGSTLETDISASKVENYDFIDPIDRIEELSKKLRTELGCEMVIVMGHDAASSTNLQIASFKGDAVVDCIINAHTHTVYSNSLTNGNGDKIPVTQAGSSGEYLTEIVFEFDNDTNSFVDYEADVLDMSLYGMDKDPIIDDMIKKMSEELAPIMDEEISIAGKYVSKSSVCTWTANEIYKSVQCDLAAINSGGIRQYAFPISENSKITVKKIYEIMPFDNLIKTAKFTGKQLKDILLINDAVFSNNVTKSGDTFYINGEEIDDNRIYVFACVDYLFDREYSIYGIGVETEILQLLVRDIMIDGLRALRNVDQRWLD